MHDSSKLKPAEARLAKIGKLTIDTIAVAFIGIAASVNGLVFLGVVSGVLGLGAMIGQWFPASPCYLLGGCGLALSFSAFVTFIGVPLLIKYYDDDAGKTDE